MRRSGRLRGTMTADADTSGRHGGKEATAVQTIATTVLERAGWRLRLGRSWRGLCYLGLDGNDRDGLEQHARRYFDGADIVDDPAALGDDVAQVGSYLEGTRRQVDLDLDLRGTPFQVAVWRELLQIPYGGTATYGEVAKAVGSPGGARAVGQAVHVNPVAIVVPCHRVVAGGGRLGGYGGGLATKRRLLALEGAPALRD
jgi:O-6-methylguanine DNA methyltransferase